MNRIKSQKSLSCCKDKNDRGVALILVAGMLVMFLAFMAMSIDIGYLYAVRNELQNAADAGALAATRELYLNDGSAVNPNANQVGYDAATANEGMKLPVEVQDYSSNNGDVQRGHWNFAAQTFTPNTSLLPTTLQGVSFATLDADPNFINSVRVVTRRESTAVRTFFAKVLGIDDVIIRADAVAYVGFAGMVSESDAFDSPIAMCEWAVLENGYPTCSRARMQDSSGGITTNTAGWTNYTQDPCETASGSSLRPWVGCPIPGSPALNFDTGIGTVGGVVDNIFRDFHSCWLAEADTDGDGHADHSWSRKMPVIECPGKNVGTCSKLVGTVQVDILWVKRDNKWNNEPAPLWMTVDGWKNGSFTCSIAGSVNPNEITDAQNEQCWSEFVTHFELLDWNDTPVSSIPTNNLKKTIYFAPTCGYASPSGGTGGRNYGVLAKIPVIVQ